MPQLTIAQKADTIATFRYLSEFLMETLARWTPLTPELEVKILFGRHLWEFAQHADAFGHRTAELRAGLHYTRPPAAGYRQALDGISGFLSASERVQSVYDALVPDLARRYHECLRLADPLLDQPTIRIVERIVQDLDRLQNERREMLADVTLAPLAPDWARQLRDRLAAEVEIVEFRPAKAVAS
jgi:hypothetical protein